MAFSLCNLGELLHEIENGFLPSKIGYKNVLMFVAVEEGLNTLCRVQ